MSKKDVWHDAWFGADESGVTRVTYRTPALITTEFEGQDAVRQTVTMETKVVRYRVKRPLTESNEA